MATLHLLLLRHAKAMPADRGVADRDRPLAARGRRDAALMGEAIARNPPDAVLCSPTKRTRETLAVVIAQLGYEPKTAFADGLYETGNDYSETISELGGSAKRLLVVGHNPTIHRTALALTGRGDAALHSMLSGKFPTAALAEIAFEVVDWSKITPGSGELMAFLRPRDLGASDADD